MIEIDEQARPARAPAELRQLALTRSAQVKRRARVRGLAVAAVAVTAAVALFASTLSSSPSAVRTTPANSVDDDGQPGAPASAATAGSGPRGDAPAALPRAGAPRPAVPTSTTTPASSPPPAAPLRTAKGTLLYAGTGGFYAVNADGTGARKVYNGGGEDARWSPDGTRILVSSGASNDVTVVDVATGATRTIRQVGEFESVVGGDWLSNGSVAYGIRRGGLVDPPTVEMYVRDLDSGAERSFAIDDQPLSIVGAPNGGIAYPCVRGSALICVLDASGHEASRIDTGGFQSSSIEFSPDGRSVAMTGFLTGVSSGRASDVAVIHTDGTGLRIVFRGVGNGRPMWLPDGKRVAVTLIGADPNPRSPLASPPACSARPCDGDTGVWSVSLDGTDAHPIVSDDRAYGLDLGR